MTPPPVNLADFEAQARAALPKPHFDFFAGGSADEVTLRENRRAFDDIDLRYRVLAGVGRRDLSVSLFGQNSSMPVLIAPTGFQKMAHPDGEIAMAKAAGACGVILVASTMANVSLEAIRAAVLGPMWFQLYVYKDRGVTRALAERAAAAGYGAIQVTVDLPVLGRREADVRNGFGLPAGLRIANLESWGFGELGAVAGDSGVAAYTSRLLDPALTWKDIEWLKSVARLPLLVKGVIRGDDAVRAIEAGADGVVVSNHGGRQLDTSPATIRALPEVAEALAGRGVVILDGGVRRGTDVIKALALGAHAVQIGRPPLWGLAVGGQLGVERVLEILRYEFDAAMALCGCSGVAKISRDLVRIRKN
ncbi:MAG: alpha-hydroxy acid oxidase [Gemmataceae bacterium]